MVDVRPFRGLLYNADRVGDLAQILSPPYDVISPPERQELLVLSAFNIVRVELPESDDGDPYAEAARMLQTWQSEGVLTEDESPSFYLYQVEFEAGGERHRRRSLVGAVRVDPWERGQVLPHERTMSAPKEDRLRLMRATHANVSPLLMLYRGRTEALTGAWAAIEAQPPPITCQLEDGTSHRLWPVRDSEVLSGIQSEFAGLRLVIADGHHRYETALQYRDELAARGELPDDHPANFVLTHLVAEADPGLVILPTHRLVRGLPPDLDQVEIESEFGADWHAEYFPIWDEAPPEQLKALLEQLHAQSQAARAIGLYGPDPTVFAILLLRNQRLLDERTPERSEAWRALDVALLDEGFLKPLLERAGLDREQSVVYERDPYAALQAVRRGEYQLALVLNATQPEQVIAVAEAGDRMPEKSTYFYPKPPTGLVLRRLDA